MAEDTTAMSRARSRDHWNQARRKAFWQRFSSALGLSREPLGLLSFEEVQHKLRLNQNAYRGLHQVPVEQIVGSVGRYHDFTRTFLPLVENDGARWRRVAELQLESGLPPVELYKVGDAYFVKDGNHRVSVARQFGMSTVEAYVWEYENPVGGIPASGTVDDLIVKAEYRAFLDRTRLNITRPDQQIILTEPGMYPLLEAEIELYRQNLERIDGEEHSYGEAAQDWYDLVYTLAVDVIRESGVLSLFPGRTEADLYIWVKNHQRELSERYGTAVSVREAVSMLAETQHARPGPVERIMQTAARSVAGLVHSLTQDHSEEREELLLPPVEGEPLGKVLAQLETCEPSMAYDGQRGEEFRAWRGSLRARLSEQLDLRYVPRADGPVEIIETTQVSGVERVKLVLEAADGLRLPAYVMYPPERQGTLPGLLVYPGHGTIAQTVGIENSAHHANALALAQAGYITITVEGRGFGELGQTDHLILDNTARLMGRTWLAMVIEDGMRALDYLQSRPDIRPGAFGVTGLGLGSGLALYTAALDERIIAVVIENYLGGGIDPLVVHGHNCDFVPGLWRYARMDDIARLVVPRPMLFVYPRHRRATTTAHHWFDKVRPSYEVFRCPDRTNFVLHDDNGDYNSLIAANWFDRWLVEESDVACLLRAPRE